MKKTLSGPVIISFITKVVLMAFFLAIILFVIFRIPAGSSWVNGFNISVMDLVLLAFATLRLGRMFTYDLVAEPLRYPFVKTVPDDMGMGDTVEPRYSGGVRGALGQLFSCPICTGTWVAGILVLCLYVWPNPSRIFITIMAVIGVAELLNSVIEALCWGSEAAHARAGADKAMIKPARKE